ncbi:MAG: hypothetical protein ACK4UN_21755 [Limisphaerales bacterium]
MAIEYPFWEERSPEALVHFGESIDFSYDDNLTAKRCSERCAAALELAQSTLAEAAQKRSAPEFDFLVRGQAGVGFFYDNWRALRARWRGENFQPEHGSL